MLSTRIPFISRLPTRHRSPEKVPRSVPALGTSCQGTKVLKLGACGKRHSILALIAKILPANKKGGSASTWVCCRRVPGISFVPKFAIGTGSCKCQHENVASGFHFSEFSVGVNPSAKLVSEFRRSNSVRWEPKRELCPWREWRNRAPGISGVSWPCVFGNSGVTSGGTWVGEFLARSDAAGILRYSRI